MIVGNIIKGFLILSFVIVLIFAWFLAVVRTFLHFDDVFSSFRPRFVGFLITWFFSLVMALFFPLSMLIGIMEMYQQWKCYKARKYMTKEQAKSTGNISIWAEAREGDKLKLIYVSLIYPLFGFLSLQKVLSTVYRLVWYRTNERIAFAAISFAIFYSYAFAIFIPLVIRFVLLRRKLKYGLEISIYFSLSFFLFLLLCYASSGDMPSSLGWLDILMLYCILSYKSSEYSEEWHSYTINPILLALIVLALMTLISGIITNQEQWYFSIWDMVLVCFLLCRHKSKPKELLSEPHPTPPPTYQPTPPDKPAQLTATALALIGRPTLHENEYLTPAMTQSRHEAERPFVKILSATYHTDTERKAMSRHFMLWKEFAVFVSLSQVLKSDKALLAQTQSKLKERLNEGLPPDVLKKRVERMRTMSVTFTAEYKISGSLEQSFLRTFRETLPDGLPELPYSESVGGYLHGIYRFIYGGLKGEYQELRERERV